MAFQLLPNLIFFAALLGAVFLVARRLPQALGEPDSDLGPEDQLLQKGLPVEFARRGSVLVRTWGKKFWHFALEAKGLRHNSVIGYRIKTILKKSGPAPAKVVVKPADPDEKYYLDLIKEHANELPYYEALAEFYQQAGKLEEAATIYEYLLKHDPSNANYPAKLGFMDLKLRRYEDAADNYQRSVSLDSSHPSRYYNLSLAYGMLDRKGEARQALESALALDVGNAKYEQALKELE